MDNDVFILYFYFILLVNENMIIYVIINEWLGNFFNDNDIIFVFRIVSIYDILYF